MADPNGLLQSMKTYDVTKAPATVLSDLSPIIAMENFTYENISKKSAAAADMTTWVISTYKCLQIYKRVLPMKKSLTLSE